MWLYDNLNVPIERHKETKTFNGELAEVAPKHLRYIRLPDAEQLLAGLELYRARPDKGYSLVDCI